MDTCLVYSVLPFGIKLSVRSCIKEVKASELAEFITAGIGSGGGHLEKAGGFIQTELLDKLYPNREELKDFLKWRMTDYFDDIEIQENTYIMIGIHGEIYPNKKEKFERSYKRAEEPYCFEGEYGPTVKDSAEGKNKSLIPYAKTCISTGESYIYAKKLDHRVKVFTAWDNEKYMLGKEGDYLAVRKDDMHDIYIIEKSIFDRTYKEIH